MAPYRPRGGIELIGTEAGSRGGHYLYDTEYVTRGEDLLINAKSSGGWKVQVLFTEGTELDRLIRSIDAYKAGKRGDLGGPYPRLRYEIPIDSDEQAEWCRREAARKYQGKVIEDDLGMYIVQDRSGLTHTDDVLRALSFYKRTPKGGEG
jgi:hypothetical protein